jgi:hypothetical protein
LSSRPFSLHQLVEVWGLAGHDAAMIGANVEPANVVAHDDKNIRFLADACASAAPEISGEAAKRIAATTPPSTLWKTGRLGGCGSSAEPAGSCIVASLNIPQRIKINALQHS